jgi:hypothetical protein
LRRPEPTLTRRRLMRGSAALACGLSLPAAAAIPSWPDVILMVGVDGTMEGFRFVNYRGRFPFWSPGWDEVLAGRPLGPGAMPADDTLADAFAAAGYVAALAPLPVAQSRSRPLLIVAPNKVDPEIATNAILIRLPASQARPGDGLLVRMPGTTAALGSSDVPMNPLDIAPTVCGLAGVPRASAFVGRDYSALVPDVGRPG